MEKLEKLSLNKEIIARLDNREITEIQAGKKNTCTTAIVCDEEEPDTTWEITICCTGNQTIETAAYDPRVKTCDQHLLCGELPSQRTC